MVPGAGARRAPSASRRAAAAWPRRTRSTCSSRGSATSGWCASGADDVLWNSDHRDALAAAVAATPDHYARLLGVAAKTRKDLYLNIDQKLALQAMFARFEEVSTSA